MWASLLLALALGAQSKAAPLAFENVSVVDVQDGRVWSGLTVVVRGDRIQSVGSGVTVPPDARRVNGEGAYLIPGLWDMHVHMTQLPRFGELYIANGVTGVRDMFTLGKVDNLKKGFISGDRVGPRVIAAGRIVDGENPIWPMSIEARDADGGRAAVSQLRADGADFVKVYSKLSREAYFAIAEEAKRIGMPFCGHVPGGVRIAEASDAGQRSIEHLGGVLAGCSSAEERLLADTEMGFIERLDLTLSTHDQTKAAALFEKLVANQTWQCPTLVVLRSISSLNDPEFIKDERLHYLPEFWAKTWDPANDFRFKSYDEADWASARRGYLRALKLVSGMHAAGVPFLAGTDCSNPFTFPGFSLHDELELLVQAGFSPAEALRTATWNPAVYFELEDELGSIAAGRSADLVLLRKNPLEDIANTREIAAVVANGRLFEREELDALLKGK